MKSFKQLLESIKLDEISAKTKASSLKDVMQKRASEQTNVEEAYKKGDQLNYTSMGRTIKVKYDKPDTNSKSGNMHLVYLPNGTPKVVNKSSLSEDVEQIDEASQKLIKKMQDLAGGADKMPRGQAFRDLKKKAEAELKKGREVSKVARRAERETPKVLKKAGEDDHIMMQLRKAQDMDGNYSIQFHKGTGELSKDEVNVLVRAFDKLKPEGKRKLRAMLKDVNAAKKLANSLKGKI